MPRRLWLLVSMAFALLAAGCAPGRPAPDFRLQDDLGHAWTLSGQHGTAVLLTFGFTHCEDTCPETLGKLEHLSARLGARASRLEIAFVTVDPQRDTPPVMHAFLSRFPAPGGSPLVGLTGTPAQIAAVENAYHVWAQKVPGRHGRGSDEYDEAHSAVIYFIDDTGRIRGLHDDDDTDAALASAIDDVLG